MGNKGSSASGNDSRELPNMIDSSPRLSVAEEKKDEAKEGEDASEEVSVIVAKRLSICTEKSLACLERCGLKKYSLVVCNAPGNWRLTQDGPSKPKLQYMDLNPNLLISTWT